ncbi:6-phosphogluconolactonase [Tomitella fengzijianii]|uniref:6-phosphogluconolactonase n=1 Tax=Tomitella fengzijianii TaxID=2597660 RepID=A0A516X2Y2_9ACTN|nr:6-phosphogluconolactonase [Tomitella fengzijianii]QDQ97439.1 6-phosphogluconolactonase [Tomitella fengzijianii]
MTTEIVRGADQDGIVTAAAARFTALVAEAVARRGRARVVLTGGGAGIGLLAALRGADIDWPKVEFFWGDERFVAADDGDRNALQAHEALLAHVPVDEALVHPMPADDGDVAGDVDAAARRYAELVEPVEAFDVHLLGMGGEGHINSIFPHSPAVAESAATAVAVRDCPKPPPTRITLTLPMVRRSREVWLLVAGEAKAQAAAAALGGAAAADVPAAGASGSDRTVWFVDDAAAAAL